MIECMGVEQMHYFISLLGDIVSFVGPDQSIILINAEAGPVFWDRIDDEYCVMKDPETYKDFIG